MTEKTSVPSQEEAPDEEAPDEEEPSDLIRKLEAFDVTAHPSGAAAIGALLKIIDPQTPKDIGLALDIMKVQIELIEMERLKHAAERQAKIDRHKAEEEARDKFGGRGENPRVLSEAPKDPEGAMRFLAGILPYAEGPIHQLADDAERATHLSQRVSAGASTARLMQAAASLALAINRIGGESRHRMIHERREKARREAEVPDYSQWVRK